MGILQFMNKCPNCGGKMIYPHPAFRVCTACGLTQGHDNMSIYPFLGWQDYPFDDWKHWLDIKLKEIRKEEEDKETIKQSQPKALEWLRQTIRG